MKNGLKLSLFLSLFLLLIAITALCNSLPENHNVQAGDWSSADHVFEKKKMDLTVKKPEFGPIRIGFTAKEVQEVMGVPDRIDEKGFTYYYRHSPIYFGENWRVKSWDNRYGNLKVLFELEKVKLGDHIRQVFHEGGFPLRIKKEGSSFQLEYIDVFIYVNKSWLVEAIQAK